MARMPETELDRLEQYLAAAHRAECLPLDMVQGLLAAVASSPSPSPQEKWQREVLGPDHAFENAAEEAEIGALLARFAEETARQLNEAEGFDFILYSTEDGEEDFATWAEGYLSGVEIADPPWEHVADADDLDNMLFPFLALTGDARRLALEAGEDWMSDAEEDALLDEIRDGLAQHLFDVRQYWFDKSIPGTVRREAPKVGRNDPCPCGSGKKYKSCHGRT